MRIDILGCPVDNLTIEETVARINEFINDGRPHQHVVVNVDKIVKVHRNPRLLDIVNRCDLINADGMPVVWASRLLGRPLKGRVAGIDLFMKLLERSEEHGWRVFFLGARQPVVTQVVKTVSETYPSLKIAGFRNGYWQSEQEESVVEEIKKANPDILFVAISSPKKEEFLGTYLTYMDVPFAMGVGGAFDVMAGLTNRAPVWMQKSGLEWFYRFLQEPKRLFRRYFVDDMYFFWLLTKQLLKQGTSGGHDPQA